MTNECSPPSQDTLVRHEDDRNGADLRISRSPARASNARNGSGSPLPSRTAIGRGGKGPTETNPAQRTDCKEIDWYRFAAQGGCTHILGRPCRRSVSIIPSQEPSSFRSPRQQLNLATAVSSNLLAKTVGQGAVPHRALVQIAVTKTLPFCAVETSSAKNGVPRPQAQLGLERPDVPVRTVSSGCGAVARYRHRDRRIPKFLEA